MMDKLKALKRTNLEFWQSFLMCFTETWLHECIPDSAWIPDNKGRQKYEEEWKKERQWNCRAFHQQMVQSRTCCCSSYIELLAVTFHPHYLQRAFTGVIVVAVYIPTSLGGDAVYDVFSSAVAKQQTQQPSMFLAVMVIVGSLNFNHVSLSLPHFQGFNSLSTGPLERIKHWICFMQILQIHTAPLHNVLWTRLIII